MKIYAGPPAAARRYLEADRGRADDYYLTEGTGIARRYTATAGRVQELAALTGDGYESWVAGRDLDTREPRGRLRTDERAVRFVEVVVNGPKSWSLAAALHPEIADAYDAAQDRAAAEIIGWLAQHATTRVGPRGGQVQLPVEVLEAVTVRHYTSRAGDPHRHLHLQLNARVFAAGKWRGLHTVGVRDFLTAVNGIGHAAVACDLQFRMALAAHGYTLDATGETQELASYVGPLSARAAQIGRNLDGYERDWRTAHPGESPGPALRRAWDARAWADGRPDKILPRSGVDLIARWRAELTALGYRDPETPVQLRPTPVGALDRDGAVKMMLTRLAASRSAWNAADLRGEAEQLNAATGIVVEPAVRSELAEDITARALSCCVPLLEREGVPEHIRAWTSAAVLEVEADLTTRLAARGDSTGCDADLRLDRIASLERLDDGQAATAAALAGSRPLVVVEGAAGTGKTTALAAARRLLEQQGRRLVVVTPTLKAAQVAAGEVGTAAASAAWLAFQHGWRWTADGAWSRLTAGQADPSTGVVYAGPADHARLRPRDLLVIDEAAMLDQDTARALLAVADECEVRIALLGDRHQLPAVGRGGVLDLAVRAADPAACLTLEAVHRFVRTDEAGPAMPDTQYAELTLAMRGGVDPGAVFDALHLRGQIRLHPDAAARLEALVAVAAASTFDGHAVAVVVGTREQAAELNAAIRDRLVAEGGVDDTSVVMTRAGQRIGAGDRIATRRNDRTLGVANRDTWTVAAVTPHGKLVVTLVGPTGGDVTPDVTPSGPPGRVLPAGYVAEHVELAYASTAHGVQGDTVPAAHVLINEHTAAAATYVGMTRGRTANTAHLVAADLAAARAQWVTVFGRDRADLGPSHAAELAASEAARYARLRPLAQVLTNLHSAWTAEQSCLDRLDALQLRREVLRTIVAADADHASQLLALEDRQRQAAIAARAATDRAAASGAVVTAEAGRLRDTLLTRWAAQREDARRAAQTVLHDPGRLRRRRGAFRRAEEQLTGWADRWRTCLSNLPTEPRRLASVASSPDDRPRLQAAFDDAARRISEAAHPEQARLRAAADAAQAVHGHASRALDEARRRQEDRLSRLTAHGHFLGASGRLATARDGVTAAEHELAAARARIAELASDPTLLAQPPDRLTQERDAWRGRRNAERARRQVAPSSPLTPPPTHGVRPPKSVHLTPSLGRSPSIGW
ncbi:MobF family relaxase [Geodermatophilus amargosae]|nr:MobF family relaxase [Geodermatophilus amargosae]